MTNQPADGERYCYKSIDSDALSLEASYGSDFRFRMDDEYQKLCAEQKTCNVNCAMVREAWQRLMLDAPAALAAAAEQLRESNANLETLRRAVESMTNKREAELRERDELRQQLAAANARLAAGVKFFTLSSDGSSGIEICKIHAGWNVYITHYGNFGPRENRHGLFESLNEAWSALVAANWLPGPEQQTQQGEK